MLELKIFSKEGPISHSEFNLKFYHVLNALFGFSVIKILLVKYIYIHKMNANQSNQTTSASH